MTRKRLHQFQTRRLTDSQRAGEKKTDEKEEHDGERQGERDRAREREKERKREREKERKREREKERKREREKERKREREKERKREREKERKREREKERKRLKKMCWLFGLFTSTAGGRLGFLVIFKCRLSGNTETPLPSRLPRQEVGNDPELGCKWGAHDCVSKVWQEPASKRNPLHHILTATHKGRSAATSWMSESESSRYKNHRPCLQGAQHLSCSAQTAEAFGLVALRTCAAHCPSSSYCGGRTDSS